MTELAPETSINEQMYNMAQTDPAAFAGMCATLGVNGEFFVQRQEDQPVESGYYDLPA